MVHLPEEPILEPRPEGNLPGAEPVITETLERLSNLARFNRWLYKTIRPHLGDRILEVGSGIGNFSDLFLEDLTAPDALLMVTDIETRFLDVLRSKYQGDGRVRVSEYWMDAEGKTDLRALRFDTFVALNVLEHIRDDDRALEQTRRILCPGGRLVLLVPALEWLYSTLDSQLGHHRRYARDPLIRKVRAAGFEIVSVRYFNLLGAFGWFLNGRILRRKLLPKYQLLFFDRIVPFARLLERVFCHVIGQSLIVVGKVPE